jgi:hypothetical protein
MIRFSEPDPAGFPLLVTNMNVLIRFFMLRYIIIIKAPILKRSAVLERCILFDWYHYQGLILDDHVSHTFE